MDSLNMSLDDIIKTSKKSGSGNSRGRARASSGPGPARRLPNRAGNRATPYGAAKAPESTWQHDMYADQGAAFGAPAGRASTIETGTKLYISNLDYGVSNEDIKELFVEVGDLKRYGVHYDRSGRSKGTADVVFSRRQDAVAAVKRYNNVMLDGKPMKIEIVGTNLATLGAPLAVPPPANGTFRNSNGAPRGDHWELSVIMLDEGIVYHLDPSRRRLPVGEWRTIVDNAIVIYNANVKNKSRKSITWKPLSGIPPQQGRGCGLWVMLYMNDIVKDKNLGFATKWEVRKGRKQQVYTAIEIDAVRNEWANYVSSIQFVK